MWVSHLEMLTSDPCTSSIAPSKTFLCQDRYLCNTQGELGMEEWKFHWVTVGRFLVSEGDTMGESIHEMVWWSRTKTLGCARKVNATNTQNPLIPFLSRKPLTKDFDPNLAAVSIFCLCLCFPSKHLCSLPFGSPFPLQLELLALCLSLPYP